MVQLPNNLKRMLLPRALLVFIASCFICGFLAACNDLDTSVEVVSESLFAEETADESSVNQSIATAISSAPVEVTMANANTLNLDVKLQVAALVVYLGINHDNNKVTDFIINLNGEKYDSYDIMGVIPVEYKQIISDYPDISAGMSQIGPNKRKYIMTIVGEFAGYRTDSETDAVNGFNMKNCELISLIPVD